MKNIILGLVIIGVLAGVYYVIEPKLHENASTQSASTSGDNKSASETAPGTQVANQGAAQATPAEQPSNKGGLLGSLRDGVIVVVGLSPRNIDPAISYLQSEWQKAMNTKLAKRFGVEQMLVSNFEKGFRESSEKSDDPSKFSLEDFYASINTTKQVWNGLNKALFVVSDRTFDIKEYKFPQLLLNASFSAPGISTQISQLIDTRVLKGQSEAKFDALTLTKNGNQYKVKVVSPDQKAQLSAGLSVEDTRAVLIVGAENDDAFKIGSGDTALTASPKWKNFSAALMPSAAYFSYFEPAKAAELALKIGAEIKDPEAKAGFEVFEKAVVKKWKELESISFSANFEQGINSKSCVALVANSEAAKNYNDFFNLRGNGATSSKFQALITDRSMIALRVYAAGLETLPKMIKDSLGQMSLDMKPEETKELDMVLEKAKQITEKFGFQELGITLNAPQGMPFPEPLVYLGGSKLKGKQLLSELQGTITELSSLSGGPGISPKLRSGSQGRDILDVLPPAQGMPLVASTINENSALFTINESSFSDVEGTINSTTPYLQKYSVGSDPLTKKLAESDVYFYVNTDSALGMARPFIPMMLASQPPQTPPDMRVESGDVEEILKLISGSLVAFTHTSKVSDQLICTDATLRGL